MIENKENSINGISISFMKITILDQIINYL